MVKTKACVFSLNIIQYCSSTHTNPKHRRNGYEYIIGRIVHLFFNIVIFTADTKRGIIIGKYDTSVFVAPI